MTDLDQTATMRWLFGSVITPTAVRDATRRGVSEKTDRHFCLPESASRYCTHLRKLVVELLWRALLRPPNTLGCRTDVWSAR
jgi:hypothetical protein